MAFLSASLTICERALREVDGVISAIRLVDYFMAPPPELLSKLPEEQQGVQVTVVGSIRLTADDEQAHEIVMTLIRPNGEESPTVLSAGQPLPVGKIPGVPRMVWIIAQVGVTPKQFGMHTFNLTLDGVEVARNQFTLAQFSTDSPMLRFSQPTVTVP